MITENGWPSCTSNQLDRSPIPGTDIVLPLQQGQPALVLKAFAADLNWYVESAYNSRVVPTKVVGLEQIAFRLQITWEARHLTITGQIIQWDQKPEMQRLVGRVQLFGQIRMKFLSFVSYWTIMKEWFGGEMIG